MRTLLTIAGLAVTIAAFALVSVAPAQALDSPAKLIRLWHAANGDCRGLPGDDPQSERGCETRENISYTLDAKGWCYGKKGEAGYQNKWHVCTRKSLSR